MPAFPAGSCGLPAILLAILIAAPTWGSTLVVSNVVSEQPAGCGTLGNDPCILADWLDASINFSVDNLSDQLTIVLSNTTGGAGDPTFKINQLYFSASGAVSSLSLATPTHSVEGAVNWSFFASMGQGGQRTAMASASTTSP